MMETALEIKVDYIYVYNVMLFPFKKGNYYVMKEIPCKYFCLFYGQLGDQGTLYNIIVYMQFGVTKTKGANSNSIVTFCSGVGEWKKNIQSCEHYFFV